MSPTLHDSASVTAVQATAVVADAWTCEVLPRLPADLEAQARHYHAFQRVRGIRTAADLLRALLAYVLGAGSFQTLGAWAVLLNVGTLSATAWRTRLHRSHAWLGWVLAELLVVPGAGGLPPVRGRIKLVDASSVCRIQASTTDWRIHTVYDLLAGRVASVNLTDVHTGEHLGWLTLQPGDIVVADAGYGTRRSVAVTVAQQADVVLRVMPDDLV